MENSKYEIGHRYGERESLSKDEALSLIDGLLDELGKEFHSVPDDEHRQVYVMDEDGDSFTAYVDGYVLLECKVSGSMKMLFREIVSLEKLKNDLKEFISNKIRFIEQGDWKSERSQLKLQEPSIFRAGQSAGSDQLHEASYQGDLDKVTLLVKSGADVDYQDADGATPIMHAIVEGHHDIVKYLIESGASLEIKDNDGCDVFELAECFDEITLLLKQAVKLKGSD